MPDIYLDNDHVESQLQCPDCGTLRTHKGHHQLTVRTAFGTFAEDSPRLRHCACGSGPEKRFSPLAELLPEHTTTELLLPGSTITGSLA